MELDEFKMLLKEKDHEEIALHSAVELEGYIRKTTRSVTDKIKRSIRFEFALGIVFVCIALWAWFRYPFAYVRPFCLLSISVCCFLFIYFGALYKKISRYEQSPLPVKNTLQKIIDILQQFTRLYFQVTMITLPINFIFGLIAGYLVIKGDAGLKNFNWMKWILFYSGWFILWSAIMYFFAKWYIKKLYGDYLLQLRQQLKDIENG
jgi:hypothetical protein